MLLTPPAWRLVRPALSRAGWGVDVLDRAWKETSWAWTCLAERKLPMSGCCRTCRPITSVHAHGSVAPSEPAYWRDSTVDGGGRGVTVCLRGGGEPCEVIVQHTTHHASGAHLLQRPAASMHHADTACIRMLCVYVRGQLIQAFYQRATYVAGAVA